MPSVVETSYGWLKLLLKMLVYIGGGVNISSYRCMSVVTKFNSCHRRFLGYVVMKRQNGAVYEYISGYEGSRRE